MGPQNKTLLASNFGKNGSSPDIFCLSKGLCFKLVDSRDKHIICIQSINYVVMTSRTIRGRKYRPLPEIGRHFSIGHIGPFFLEDKKSPYFMYLANFRSNSQLFQVESRKVYSERYISMKKSPGNYFGSKGIL